MTKRLTRLANGGFFGSAVCGLVLTAAVYRLLPALADPGGLVARYLTGHPLEYVITGLAAVAVVELVRRAAAVTLRRRDVRAAERAGETAAAAGHADPVVRRRLSTLNSLRERGGLTAEAVQRLSDRAHDDLAAGYASLTTICWAVPIVGFLGTVMGITIAVANISPEQLEDSLGSVTGGLAVAFDTTALALGASLVLGFGTLFVRRAEERLLGRLDDLSDALAAPHIAAAGDRGGSAELVEAHVAAWSEALGRQRDAFGQSLESGHRHFVASWADVQAGAVESQRLTWEVSSDQMGEALADWQAKLDHTLARIAEGIPEVASAATARAAEETDAALAAVREHQVATHRQLESVAHMLGERAAQSEAAFARCEALAADVTTRMAEQNRLWADVAEKTAAIETLQASADSQFDRARLAEQMDQTLHQLTAAVHMLTARAKAA